MDFNIPVLSVDEAIAKLVREASFNSGTKYFWVAENFASLENIVLPAVDKVLRPVNKRDFNVTFFNANMQYTIGNGSDLSYLFLRSGEKADSLRGSMLDGLVLSGWLGKSAYLSAMSCLEPNRGWAMRVYE